MYNKRFKFYFLLALLLIIGRINAQDWLLNNFQFKAQIEKKGNQIILDNGLLRRSFLLNGNIACTDYTNLTNGQQLIRSIEPEASVLINKIQYNIGGLEGQKENAI